MKINNNCFMLCLGLTALWINSIWTYSSKPPPDATLTTTVTENLLFTQSTVTGFNNRSRNLTPTKRQTHHCRCQNGGSCIRRTLACLCPSQYRGSRCQIKVEYRSCGNLRHGDISYENCEVCQCFDSELICDDSFRCEDVTNLINLVNVPHQSDGRRQQPFGPTLVLLSILVWQQSRLY